MLLVNNIHVPRFKFSGGEIQIKLPDNIPEERITLTWKPNCSDHIMELLLTINALKHAGWSDIDLDILYLPYARQDRVCAPGEAFSLEVIAKILDSAGLTTVRVYDVHNQDALFDVFNDTWIVNVEAKDIFLRHNIMNNFDVHDLVLCCPDNGALRRVSAIADNYHLSRCRLVKQRCTETGKILSIELSEYSDGIVDSAVLVIDDICDGGATFIEAAKVLKENGAANLYLYVTHGIFSKGLDVLLEHYEHIYCHHVLHDDFKSDEKLTILKEFANAS